MINENNERNPQRSGATRVARPAARPADGAQRTQAAQNAQRPAAQNAQRPAAGAAASRTAAQRTQQPARQRPEAEKAQEETRLRTGVKTVSARTKKLAGGVGSLAILAVCVVAVILYLIKGGSAAGTAPVSHGVEISEAMTSNKGAVSDDNGHFSDWIELHNTTSGTIDIGGFGLSDDKLGLVKWTVPKGTEIGPDEYLIIWCSGNANDGALYVPFKISASDTVTLSTENGKIADQVDLKPVSAGMSYAKGEDGRFGAMSPTPGYPNTAEGLAAYTASLRTEAGENPGVYINEFMASNASTILGPDGTYCDWIELYNTTGNSIDLSGYGISDTTSMPLKARLPKGTKIEPYSVLLIFCTGAKSDDADVLQVPFGLRAYGESIVLSDPKGRILDSVDYSRMETDQSIMRSPDGTGIWQVTTRPTPGYVNTQSGFAAYQASQSYGKKEIYLSELLNANYSTMRQADLSYPDWIEIGNRSSSTVNLSGYALSNNAKNPAKWVFPDISIAPGEYTVVLATGNNVTDTQKKNLETNFGLSGDGETVFLFSPEGEIIDKLQVGRGHADVSYGRTNGQLMYYSEPTPGAANGTGCVDYADAPEILTPSGVYRNTVTIEIRIPEGCYAYYTIDGSVPTESSARYSGPLTVTNNTVFRIRSFRPGYEPSDVSTASYFVLGASQTTESHETNFAIVSLVTDNDNFFSNDTGIYVAGSKFASITGEDAGSFTLKNGTNEKQWKYANFNAQHLTWPDPLGLEWERPVHFEIIDEDGKFEYGDDAMVRIFGAFSRFEEQKGMAIVTRSGYGTSTLNDAIFPTRDYTSYQSIVLRPSAMDWKMSKIRDILIQGLLEDAGSILPTQAYRRCIVYINGRYWGIYNIREKVNKHFLAQHYNVDPDSIDILVANGVTEAAQISGNNAYLEYKDLIDWVTGHDLSNAENYAYVKSKIDVESFAEYCAMEIAVGNTDTGNIKFWKSSALDNKWRWIPYDFDWAYNRNDSKDESTTSGYRRNFFAKYFHEKGHGVGKGFSTVLSRGLLKNSEFRALFLQKCAYMYKNVYSTENLLARIEQLEKEMADEIVYDTDRWSSFSLKTWQTSIENLKDSARNAPEYFIKYCQSYFNLSNSDTVALFGKVSSK